MLVKFLSWSYAAPTIAAFFLIAGFLLGFFALMRSRSVFKILFWGLSALCAATGVFMAAGIAAYHVGVSRDLAALPQPGVKYDVGGYGIHVWCEGERKSGVPTVVWIPGGYSAGLYSWHLHDAWRKEGRSCLVDRAGTGWSDYGPLPRTIKAIAREFDAALAAAGETGPKLLVGHSLGGLVAVNWAARYPDNIIGVVSLDPTPHALVDTEGVRRPGGWCGAPSPTGRMLRSMFGIGYLFPKLHPMNSERFHNNNVALEPVFMTLRGMESRTNTAVPLMDHFNRFCYSGYQTIRYPGELGDLPVLSIVQSFEDSDDLRAEAEKYGGVTGDFEWRNYLKTREAAAREYPNFSSAGKLIYAPKGYTHNFPVDHPDFVLMHMREFIRSLPEAAGMNN